jgi:hypothetical protein
MPVPGVDVSLLETPGSLVSIPVDTGVAFVAGLSDMGPADVTKAVFSLDDFITKYGDRQAYSSAYDWVQTFFREGGNKLYFARVVGPAATKGTKNLNDAGAAISLVATAVGPGAWSANYKVAVLTGTVAGTFIIQVTDATNNVLEDSGNLLDQAAAVSWAQSSQYIRFTLGASALDPAPAAAAALSAGSDDRNNITDTQWASAYLLFAKDLGPGQVVGVGRTATAGHDQLVAHAEANNRVALLDLIDSNSEATLAGNVSRSRFAAAFAPWVQIPSLVSGGTPRTVPASALIAGLVARNDPSLGANHPAAGRYGLSNYAVGLSQPAWNDSTRTTLNNDGIDVIRQLYGTVTVYGWRSTVDRIADPDWIDFGNARLFMKLSAELDQVGQNYLFEEIDGQHGQTIGGFHDALAGVLLQHYTEGELFGDTADQAFQVDTGPSVNTLATIADLELRAICYVKMSPFAEHVIIQVVKRSVEEV